MRTPLSKLTVGLVLLVLVASGLAFFAASTNAAPPNDGLFVDTTKKGIVVKTADPTVVRSRTVELRLSQFDSSIAPARSKVAAAQPAKTVTLNLFPDVSLVAALDRVQLKPNGFLWKGHINGVAGSMVTFALQKGVLSGSIYTPKAIYSVRYAGNNVHTVTQLNPKGFPAEAKAVPVDKKKLAAPRKSADASTNIDLLVVYTPAARDAFGGDAGISTAIDNALLESNGVLDNSLIGTHFTIVAKALTNYTESGDFTTDLNRLQNPTDGFMDDVTGLRTQRGADIVTLVETGVSFCGQAFDIMNPVSTEFSPYAFDIVAAACLTGNFTFVHEIGHIMSARHDWATDPTDNAPYSYNHGYVLPSLQARTVMAYGTTCSDCMRLPYFSNPGLTYSGTGEALGVPEGTTHAADNHKTLNNTAPTVANFMQSVSPIITPTLPVLISPSGTITTGTPTFTWHASTNGNSYLLWADGPAGNVIQQWFDATAIGCGSGGTCSVVSPVTLTTNGQYTWFVRAFSNSGGLSDWSLPLSFILNALPSGVPAVPRLIGPSGVVVSPVTFTWYAVTNTITYTLSVNSASFTVPSSSCSGSACANIQTLIPGTYPWTVTACNSSGCSAASTPLTITVTTGPTPTATATATATPTTPSPVLVPTAISPTGTLSINPPTFQWTPIVTATSYTLWITGTGGYQITFNLTNNTDLCPAGTNCAFPAVTAFPTGTYNWQVRACNGSTCGGWSNQLQFTVASTTTCTVTQIAPSGTITNTQPTFQWSFAGGCTSFYVWVSGSTADAQWVNADATVCTGQTCTWTPDFTLSPGSYAWWIFGYPNGQWTGPKNFQIVTTPPSGFTSPPWTAWQGTSGSWFVVGTPPNDWFYTQGVPGKFASAAYPGSFSNLDYEVKLFRYGCSWCAHGIDIRGTPGSPDGGWMNAYQFEINRNGYFSVWRGVNDTWTALQYWTYSPFIAKGDNWNTMRVVMVGSNMSLYVNGVLIWTGSDTQLTSGQVGAFIARVGAPTTNDALILASAKVTVPTTMTAMSAADVAADQKTLNADAQKKREGTIAEGPH